MTTDKDYMDLVVKEAAHGDAGRGMARLSIDVMKQLNLVSGDVIEISGKKKAAAIVWPGFPEDTGRAVIRIDGNIRSNAGAGIDDKVRIKKAGCRICNKGCYPADTGNPACRRGTVPETDASWQIGIRRPDCPGKCTWKPTHLRHLESESKGHCHCHRRHRDRAERNTL
jgi:Cell division protein 48 (CDC48), N-terminal domain.